MKNGHFWKLFAAQIVSTLGDCFGLFALQWFVYTTTGSLVIMGTLAMTAGVVELVVRFIGAPLIDRIQRLRLMALLDAIRFTAIGITVVLSYLGLVHLWVLFAMAIINAAASALFQPASMAVLPSFIPKQSLVRGYSLIDASQYGAVILGPAIAGFVISSLGAASALAIDAVSFAISALFIFLIPTRLADSKEYAPPASGLYYRELWDGITFFKKAPALLGIMICVAMKNMCSVAVGGMMIPFAMQHLHANASQIGLLSSAMAGGICLGSLLVSMINNFKRRRIPMLGSIFAHGLLYMALSQTSSFMLALCWIVLLGVCGPFFGTFSSSLYAQMVPSELRGRVMSARLMVGGSLQPAGSYMGGIIANSYGIPVLLVIAGSIPILTAFAAYFAPVMKGIDGELGPIRVETVGLEA
ncbi:MFS transporter [Paenibacillus planticolens]|uniref:MFS transporter n=1 Tax=Paenibacillus planticolens TaxID=2654976 RepID=UPI0014916854|nr:MFS transporter [Paenibacillus planticolens]